MAIAHVQTGKNSASVGTDRDAAVTLTLTAGNILVLIGAWVAGPSFTSIAATGVTFTQLGTQITTGGGNPQRMYYAENIPGGSTTMTFTVSAGNGFPTLIVSEFSGVKTSASQDTGAGTNGGPSTAANSGTTATRDTADEVLVVGVMRTRRRPVPMSGRADSLCRRMGRRTMAILS